MKMRPLFLLALLLATFTADAQDLQALIGTWKGRFEKIPLSIVFRVRPDTFQAGKLTGDWDSPDQGGFNFPIGRVDYISRDSVLFLLPSIGGQYRARLVGDSLHGVWVQSGMPVPLRLHRTDTSGMTVKPKRPQVPAKPYPYREEEVLYRNADSSIQYSGALTFPKSGHSFPAVILITGSGQEDRDETLFGHKPFLIIADYLTRRGIAVLRVDDRGIGRSTGEVRRATSEDFAKDVMASIRYLKSRPGIDTTKIGLVGHSEGGLIAPMVAAQSRDVAFMVLLAGPGVNGRETLASQVRHGGLLSGYSDTAVNALVALNGQLAAFSMDMRSLDRDLLEGVDEVFRNWKKTQSPETLHTLDLDTEQKSNAYLRSFMSRLRQPWMQFFLHYEPSTALKQVKCPVLALNGSKDWQVDAAVNLAAIKQALEAGGNRQYETRVLPGLNHLFQTAQTGASSEYAQIEETFSPEALRIMGDWIVQQAEKNK